MRKIDKKKKNSDFWNTVWDIRNMTASHQIQSKAKTFKIQNKKIKEKGCKIPLKILNQVRKKAVTTLKEEKESHRTEDVQYESLAKTKDVKFLEKLKAQKKRNGNSFLQNKYKFKDMKSKGVGKFKGGALVLSKKDIYKMRQKK